MLCIARHFVRRTDDMNIGGSQRRGGKIYDPSGQTREQQQQRPDDDRAAKRRMNILYK